MLAYQFLVYLTSTLIVIPFVMKRFNDLVQIFSGKKQTVIFTANIQNSIR